MESEDVDIDINALLNQGIELRLIATKDSNRDTNVYDKEENVSNDKFTNNKLHKDYVIDMDNSFNFSIDTQNDLKDLVCEFKKIALNDISNPVVSIINTTDTESNLSNEDTISIDVKFKSIEVLESFINLIESSASKCLRYEFSDPKLSKFNILPGNLYIRNLPQDLTSNQLYNIFSKFGDIQSCKIISDNQGVSKGFGFINFTNKRMAQLAIDELNDKVIPFPSFSASDIVDDKDMRTMQLFVNHHTSKRERLDKLNFDRSFFTTLYVSNLPVTYDEDDIYELFKSLGKIKSIFIPYEAESETETPPETNTITTTEFKNENTDTTKKISKGYGFVNFWKHQDAIQAMNEMNNYEIDQDHRLVINRGERKHEKYQYHHLNDSFSSVPKVPNPIPVYNNSGIPLNKDVNMLQQQQMSPLDASQMNSNMNINPTQSDFSRFVHMPLYTTGQGGPLVRGPPVASPFQIQLPIQLQPGQVPPNINLNVPGIPYPIYQHHSSPMVSSPAVNHSSPQLPLQQQQQQHTQHTQQQQQQQQHTQPQQVQLQQRQTPPPPPHQQQAVYFMQHAHAHHQHLPPGPGPGATSSSQFASQGGYFDYEDFNDSKPSIHHTGSASSASSSRNSVLSTTSTQGNGMPIPFDFNYDFAKRNSSVVTGNIPNSRNGSLSSGKLTFASQYSTSLPSSSSSSLSPGGSPYSSFNGADYFKLGLPIPGPNVQDSNLYINGIPLYFKDQDLLNLFEKFGTIVSARIMSYQNEDLKEKEKKEDSDNKEVVKEDDEPNTNEITQRKKDTHADADTDTELTESEFRSKGFGFVCFRRSIDASKALIQMNGLEIHNEKDGSIDTLQISFAQRKESRTNRNGSISHYNQNWISPSNMNHSPSNPRMRWLSHDQSVYYGYPNNSRKSSYSKAGQQSQSQSQDIGNANRYPRSQSLNVGRSFRERGMSQNYNYNYNHNYNHSHNHSQNQNQNRKVSEPRSQFETQTDS